LAFQGETLAGSKGKLQDPVQSFYYSCSTKSDCQYPDADERLQSPAKISHSAMVCTQDNIAPIMVTIAVPLTAKKLYYDPFLYTGRDDLDLKLIAMFV